MKKVKIEVRAFIIRLHDRSCSHYVRHFMRETACSRCIYRFSAMPHTVHPISMKYPVALGCIRVSQLKLGKTKSEQFEDGQKESKAWEKRTNIFRRTCALSTLQKWLFYVWFSSTQPFPLLLLLLLFALCNWWTRRHIGTAHPLCHSKRQVSLLWELQLNAVVSMNLHLLASAKAG